MQGYQPINGLAYDHYLGYNSSIVMNTDDRKKRTPKWILYVLKCRDDTWYTGITTDLARRVLEHNAGRASRYTRSRLPITVIYQEPCSSRSTALKKEYAVKQLSRKEKAEYMTSYPGVNTARSDGSLSTLGRPRKPVRKKAYD